MLLRSYPFDGGRLYFDRSTGLHVRLSGPRFSHSLRSAPRVVQLGLTNRCNLRCSFCFRDRALRSQWTAEEILDWAITLADGGVLEIGFGQGEPLLFPGFAKLVRSIHEATPLAVNFTTNGLELDDSLLDELGSCYGQMRLSFYEHNAPLARAQWLAARNARFGVNLLVTPESLQTLPETIDRLFDAGCHDLLLLSYNGPDPSLHLTAEDDRRLARAVLEAFTRYGDRLALKLSVCFGRRLKEVPQIPLLGDCLAGEDFLTLDSEKRLLPCSFHHQATPVSSAQEALLVWRAERHRRAHAGLRGCARNRLPLAHGKTIPQASEILVWQGFASNHSTSYTLVGELPSEAKSEAYVAEVMALLEAAKQDPKNPDAPPSPTLWRALGREGAPPHPAWEASPMYFWAWHPDAVLAGGRRVLVHLESTLQSFEIYAHLLFRHHGRILWQDNYRGLDMRLAFGMELGSSALEIARALGPLLLELELRGERLYGVAASYQIERIEPILRRFRRSIAITHPSKETLAEALANPMPLPPRKRHTEWLFVRRMGVETWNSLFSTLKENPKAAMAALGSHAPFRLPARIEAHPFMGGTILRSEGAPIAGALQEWLLEHKQGPMELVPRKELRVVLELPEGTEDRPHPLGGFSQRDADALSHSGGSVKAGEFRSSVDLVPKNPIATLAQLNAMYGRRGRMLSGIMSKNPLADAVARIEEDLDG